jgi:hypothetical protein
MVAIGCDDLITLLLGHLKAHDHGLLANIEVTESADEPHAVELSGLFLETADQQHVTIGALLLFGAEARVFQVGLLGLATLARHVG